MIKVSRWHRGRRPRVSTVRAWSWLGWESAVRSESAATTIAVAQNGKIQAERDRSALSGVIKGGRRPTYGLSGGETG